VERFFAFSRRFMESVTSWIATGPRIRDVMCRHGVSPDRVTILPHSLPDDRLQRSPAPPSLEGRPVRIGYFGRISPEKGVGLLAGALRSLANRSSRSFEWWVISGSVSLEDRRELQQRSGLPNERIRFVEGLRGVDLNVVIAQLDVCVLPSLCPEIGPLTLLEALAQGVPCICNDTAGHAYLVQDGVNGFLFPTGQKADLVRKIHGCLADDAGLERLRGHPCPVAPFADFVRNIAHTLDAARTHRSPTVAQSPP
jgi:glycosyltransferase involved in cell wall biosynthesis